MKKSAVLGGLAAAIILLMVVVLSGSMYTVNEREQVIITQFGEPMGIPVMVTGLKFKSPFIQKVNRIKKGILEFDGPAHEMPTKDKAYIIVDTYGRWQITDPLKYFQMLGDERRARSRMDDIFGSETRNTIAKHDLIEVTRATKDSVRQQADEIVEADLTGAVGTLPRISRSRTSLEEEIFAKSREKLEAFGVELLDFRFKSVQLLHPLKSRLPATAKHQG